MSQKELGRLDIVRKLAAGQLNGSEAAKALKLSVRQTRRLKVGYLAKGAKALMHAGRGKPGNRRLAEKEAAKIGRLLREKYPDFGPSFAAEKLFGRHGIKRDPKTIRRIMIELELWRPRRRQAGQYHAWRERKTCPGELIQYDGSYERWFEDRGPECCLLASIDDATGQVEAKFETDEGTLPTMRYWQGYLERYGKPKAIYVDKFSTYSQNHRIAKENADNLTQFQRAARQLDIEVITANSPQAKGRVERLFRTLQDRLIKELRLAGISTTEEANRFLAKTFLPEYNVRFAVEPRNQADLHRQLNKAELAILPSILSKQSQRVIQNDFTVSHDKVYYQLLKEQRVTICRKDKIIVEERVDGSLRLALRGKELAYRRLPERPKKQRDNQWVIAASGGDARKSGHKPKPDHTWKKPFIYSNSLMSPSRTFLNPPK